MNKTITIIWAFFALTVVSCNQKGGKLHNFDSGKFENGAYVNDYFNLKMSIPADWHVLSQNQNDNLMNNSEKIISEENRALQQAAETSKITTVILLTASQYGLEVNDSIFNPNIMLIAENLEGSQKVNVPSDYLLTTKKALLQDPTPKQYPFSSFLLKNINGTDFSQMRVVNNVSENTSFTQDYFVTLENGFALTYVLTYNSEIQHDALEQILQTIKISH